MSTALEVNGPLNLGCLHTPARRGADYSEQPNTAEMLKLHRALSPWPQALSSGADSRFQFPERIKDSVSLAGAGLFWH